MHYDFSKVLQKKVVYKLFGFNYHGVVLGVKEGFKLKYGLELY